MLLFCNPIAGILHLLPGSHVRLVTLTMCIKLLHDLLPNITGDQQRLADDMLALLQVHTPHNSLHLALNVLTLSQTGSERGQHTSTENVLQGIDLVVLPSHRVSLTLYVDCEGSTR